MTTTRDELRENVLREDANQHQPDDHGPDICGDPECFTACVVDGCDWPCATAWLRDQLDQAEARIRDLTQEVRDERAACLDQIEQVKIRDGRIQAVEDVLDRVRAVHQPSDPDDPSACPFSCTCGWWAYDECPTVRALDGT